MPNFHPTTDNVLSVLASVAAFIVLPQTYRGYTYSFVGNEICYYLGSRFYIPKLGRFLNADKHFDTGTGVIGTNMYAYCNNNPIMFIDPQGEQAQENQTLNMNQIVSMISSMNKVATRIKTLFQTLINQLKFARHISIANKLVKQNYTINGYKSPNIVVNTKAQALFFIYESRFRNMGKNNYLEFVFYYGTLSYWQNQIATYLKSQIGPIAYVNEFFGENEVLGLAFSEVLYSLSPYVGLAWDAFDILCSYIENSNPILNCIRNRVDSEKDRGRKFTGKELVIIFASAYNIHWSFSNGNYKIASTKDIYKCNDF